MSWAKLLADNRVTALPPSKAELDNLRSIVARSLKDVTAVGLSADYRFVMAYDAARMLSLLVVRAARLSAPYRGRALQYLPGTGGGRHSLRKIVCLFRWLPDEAEPV